MHNADRASKASKRALQSRGSWPFPASHQDRPCVAGAPLSTDHAPGAGDRPRKTLSAEAGHLGIGLDTPLTGRQGKRVVKLGA